MFGLKQKTYGPLRMLPDDVPLPEKDLQAETEHATLVLAGGCFWCVEAVFKEVEGVLAVRSGYVGGAADTANYRAVCSGSTGHAEAVEITYDPKRISYGHLLKIFMTVAHDPTQLNRQGNDVGTQYRSAVFFQSDAERDVVESYVQQLEKADVYISPIATTIEPMTVFHEAEEYHQNYAERNPGQPYITHVSMPKVQKLRTHYGPMLKR